MTDASPVALPGRFDGARFRRLIELVGPDMAPTLLHQLAADLAECGTRLEAALQGDDRAALRRATHDLTALAGSCGALQLQALAQDLNEAAHHDGGTAIPEPTPALWRDLAALLAVIRATANGDGPW